MGISYVCSVLEEDFNTPHDTIPWCWFHGGDPGDGEAAAIATFEAEDEVADGDALKAELQDAIYELAVRDFGGSYSAEHGVGLLLRDRVGPQKSDIEWEMMRTVKRALDPQNLFNPGKLIPLAD